MLRDELEGAEHAVGPRFRTTHMALVELRRRFFVLGIVCGAGRFVAIENGLNVRRQVRAQLARLLDPLRNARRGARENQALQPARLRQRVLHREHAAP